MLNVVKFSLPAMVTLAAAGCGPGKGGGGLPESIDGNYTITAMNYFGEVRVLEDIQKMRPEARKVTFAEGKMTTNTHGSPQTYDLAIDRTKSPAQVVFTRQIEKDGQTETETTYGAIAMVGGYLTVSRCVTPDLKPEDRPTTIKNGEKFLTIKLKKDS